MAKDIRRSSLPIGAQKHMGEYQALVPPEQSHSQRHHFFARSPAGKLKRFFQRYRSQSEANDGSYSIDESLESLSLKSGRMFGDLFLCNQCAKGMDHLSDRQKQRQRGDSLKEELFGGDSDPACTALPCWQSVHKWNSSSGDAPSDRQSCSSPSADSGIPTPSLMEMIWNETDCEFSSGSGTTEQVISYLMHKHSIVAGDSRRDSGHGDEEKSNVVMQGVNNPALVENVLICAVCSARVPVADERSDRSSHISSKILSPTVECADNSDNSKHSTGPSSNAPASMELGPKPRLSQRLRLRSISTCDYECGNTKDEVDHATTMVPPKEPSKLPSCMPNSGITFADGKLRLADKKRLRSLSTSTDTRYFRSAKSKSLVEGNMFGDFWSSNQQLWQTLHDTRQFHVLEQALAEENKQVLGKMPVTSCLSRISENNRYVMLSRTPCVDRKACILNDSLASYQDADIFLSLFRHSSMYDVLPESGKLIVLYNNLSVDRAYNALVNNQILAGAVWDPTRGCFDGVFDLRFFVPICHYFCSLALDNMAAYKRKTIADWKEMIQTQLPPSVTLHPDQHLHYAVNQLQGTGARHVSVFDPVAGNILGLVSPARMFRYLCHRRAELPLSSLTWMQQVACGVMNFPLCSVAQCCLITRDTPMPFVLELLMQEPAGCRVLPVMEKKIADDREDVDGDVGRLVDVLTEMDCVHFLLNYKSQESQATVEQCLKYNTTSILMHRRIVRSRSTETVANFVDKFYYYDTEFIVVVENYEDDRLLGIVYVHDFLNWLIFRGE